MRDLSLKDLSNITLIKLIDSVINDGQLNKVQKIRLLEERKLKLYYNLRYHNLTKQMIKEMKSCINYINENLRIFKSTK